MLSQPSQCLTLVAAKKFSERFQWTTRVSQHFIRIMSTCRSKRNDHTTILSISNRGNVSYGSFLGVQKGSEGIWRGFCEEFTKSTSKSDQTEKTSRLQTTWKNLLDSSRTQPRYQSTCQGSYLSSKSIGWVVWRMVRLILSETWAAIDFYWFSWNFTFWEPKLRILR